MVVLTPRASISQDYWGGLKRRLGVWGTEVPSGIQGQSPGRGLGDEFPQKLKLFVKLHIIFAIKYNKQQLLLLLDKINQA